MMKEKGLKIKYRNNTRFGYVKLKIKRDPKKTLIDFHPFFEEYFFERDKIYRGSTRGRIIGKDKNFDIRFSMEELWETFMGRYTPIQMINFFKGNTEESNELTQFLREIETFEDKYKIALPVLGRCGKNNQLLRIRFLPVNFSLNEMNDLIKLNIRDLPEDDEKHEYGNNIARDGFSYSLKNLSIPIYSEQCEVNEDVRSIRKLRVGLLEKDPVVVLPWTLEERRGIKNLNDPFEFIRKYSLPTDHLDVCRKSSSQSL